MLASATESPRRPSTAVLYLPAGMSSSVAPMVSPACPLAFRRTPATSARGSAALPVLRTRTLYSPATPATVHTATP